MARLTINGKTREVNVDPSTPLLWALREQVGLTGTKYGCGIAQCGACTVHIDGKPVRSCIMPVGSVASSPAPAPKFTFPVPLVRVKDAALNSPPAATCCGSRITSPSRVTPPTSSPKVMSFVVVSSKSPARPPYR